MMKSVYGVSSKSALEFHPLDSRKSVIPKLSSYIVACRVLQNDAVHILQIWHGAQNRRCSQLICRRSKSNFVRARLFEAGSPDWGSPEQDAN